jgi:hypothetical protein
MRFALDVATLHTHDSCIYQKLLSSQLPLTTKTTAIIKMDRCKAKICTEIGSCFLIRNSRDTTFRRRRRPSHRRIRCLHNPRNCRTSLSIAISKPQSRAAIQPSHRRSTSRNANETSNRIHGTRYRHKRGF